jgi:hypothetical protein
MARKQILHSHDDVLPTQGADSGTLFMPDGRTLAIKELTLRALPEVTGFSVSGSQ